MGRPWSINAVISTLCRESPPLSCIPSSSQSVAANAHAQAPLRRHPSSCMQDAAAATQLLPWTPRDGSGEGDRSGIRPMLVGIVAGVFADSGSGPGIGVPS